MARLGFALISVGLLASVGCESLGQMPAIDPTDYSYMFYQNTVTEVFPYNVPQVDSATMEALHDLAFRDISRKREGDTIIIKCKTPDKRPAIVEIKPRNAMASLAVTVNPLGDEMVSQNLIQRVGLNFGMVARTIVPMEQTLSRRIDPLTKVVAPAEPFTITPIPLNDLPNPLPPAAPGPFTPQDPAADKDSEVTPSGGGKSTPSRIRAA